MLNTCTLTCSQLMALIKILGIAGNLLTIKARYSECVRVRACVCVCAHM